MGPIKQSPAAGKPVPVIKMFVLAIHLLLAGIVALFLGICYAYIFSDNQFKWQQFHLPKIFWISSFCVLIVSFCLQKCLHLYKHDKPGQIFRFLVMALFFAISFLVCQIIGWKQMYAAGLTLSDTPSAGYIYVLSGLHAVHITAGIIFLMVAIYRILIYLRDPVTSLLYITDPVKHTRLRLLAHYWHTIDFLWIFLFLVFLYQHA